MSTETVVTDRGQISIPARIRRTLMPHGSAIEYGLKLATTKWGYRVPFAPGRDPGFAGVRRISSMRDREVRGLYKALGVEPTDSPFPPDIVEKHNGYANTVKQFPFLTKSFKQISFTSFISCAFQRSGSIAFT